MLMFLCINLRILNFDLFPLYNCVSSLWYYIYKYILIPNKIFFFLIYIYGSISPMFGKNNDRPDRDSNLES